MADSGSLPGHQFIGDLSALPNRGLLKVTIAATGAEVCVVVANKEKAEIFAMSNACPHKQVDLSIGDIEEFAVHGICVKCPRHRVKMNGGLNIRVRPSPILV
jgi:nitrite reductase/ring-hydroxylating ferredoxin subunit